MPDHHIRGNKPSEFPTRERVFITERLNNPQVPQVSLADARVEPAVLTELHSLSVDEWYIIRTGSGLMEVGGREPFPVAAGDSVYIPAGTSQRIRNTSDGDLLLECICQPRFTPGSYTPLE